MARLYSKDRIRDLVLLEPITENNILKALRRRFGKDLIYTYIGAVLISVNPFKLIRGLYSASQVNSYKNRYMYEMPPHVYALAEDTYRMLLTDHQNQCVIISGESGSGKTEASKLIMQYIAAVSGGSQEIERVKNQILQSNPVLECFGNAKTLRNNNSSRFGKYMEIFFDFKGDPIGGKITNYLLEKSRVVSPVEGERNFHVFYQLAAGISPAERANYRLKDPKFYKYLNVTKCFRVERMNDHEEFELTLEGMLTCGISNDDIAMVFRTISAVLWIGQIGFSPRANDSCTIRDTEPVHIVSDLLQVPYKQIKAGFTYRHMQAGSGKAIKTNLTVEKAYYTRDALAKTIYSKLFDWIIRRVNKAIDVKNLPQYKKADLHTIGVLDIYGFEIFYINSFEQFCINYVNEKLQQIFIEKTLKSEQDEYKKEHIKWTPVKYFNNKVVCDLIEKRPKGIMAYLDEECLIPQGSDLSFLRKINQYLGDHPHLAQPEDMSAEAKDSFVLRHYAGDVMYCVYNFVDKNKDLVWTDLILIGEASSMKIFKSLFPAGGSKKLGRKRPITAGTRFKTQVNKLMATLGRCVPHYIRCIKPNNVRRSGVFEDQLSLHQVRYLGLYENVRVRRAGFAFRCTFRRFLKRYKLLCPQTWPMWEGVPKRGVLVIMKHLGIQKGQQFQMGVSKIFIRKPVNLFALENLRERKLNDLATLIQKVYRSWKARKYFLELRDRALGLFGKHKARRRISVKRYYVGDYLGINDNIKIRQLMLKFAEKRVLFVDNVDKINKKFKSQPRVVMLTELSVYNLMPGKYKCKRRIEISKIGGVSMSPKADNYFVIHVPSEYDYLMISERKTEFLTALCDQYQQIVGQELPLTFSNSFTYLLKSKKQFSIRFVDCKTQNTCTHATNPQNNKELIVSVGNIDVVNSAYLAKCTPSFMKKSTKKKRVGRHFRGYSSSSGLSAQTKSKFLSPSSNNDYKRRAPRQPRQPARRPRSPPKKKEIWAQAQHDFEAQEKQELSFRAGDLIKILSREQDGWWSGELNGKLGYVPSTYIKIVKSPRGRSSSRKGVPLPKPYGKRRKW